MRAQGGRYEPVLAPLSLSRSVSTLLESDSASHMDTKAAATFPLGEDHPIEKITRYPIRGGALCRYNVVALHNGLCMPRWLGMHSGLCVPWWLGMLDTPGWPKSAT